MAEDAKNKKNTNLIIGICCAVVAVALIIVLIVVLMMRGGGVIGGLSDAYFVSDDTKYVLTLGSDDIVMAEGEVAPVKMHLAYYYDGDAVVGEKTYYEYADEATAKQAYDYYVANSGGIYESITQDGKYVILMSKVEDFEGVTAEDVKQQMEFMEMIKNMDFDEAVEDDVEINGDAGEDVEVVEVVDE